MTRAELRRNERDRQKSQGTYVMTKAEIDKIRQQAYQKAKDEYLKESGALAEEILRMMLVIPTNILITDYWEKSAKKRIPQFVTDCISLYQSWVNGTVDMDEMQKLTEEYSGIKLIKDGSATANVVNCVK